MRLVQIRVVLALLVLSLAPARARAEPTVRLRFAAIAPEGTDWARTVKAFARDIESGSDGKVAVKVYLGGIAGDDLEMGRRMRRDQLDGVLSAGTVCQEVAPSFKVMRIPGLLQGRAESSYVLTRLLPRLREEARAHGAVLLAVASLGRDVVLSRVPIDSLATLRKLNLWQWELEPTSIAYSRAMGLRPVPLPVVDAGRAYEEGRTDGFIAIPTAIFGFQWFARQVYLSELPFAPVHGCFVMSAASYDRLPTDLQQAVQAAAGRMGVRFAETTRLQDEQLLGGLFARQGVRTVPVSSALRGEFLEACRDARDRLRDQLVPEELVLKVLSLLADYRGEHP